MNRRRRPQVLICHLKNFSMRQLVGHAQALARVVAQVANPVRWDLCCATLLELGVTGLLEVAPGGVLTGLARRTLPGVETVAVKTPADLDAARDLVRRHASSAVPTSASSQEQSS